MMGIETYRQPFSIWTDFARFAACLGGNRRGVLAEARLNRTGWILRVHRFDGVSMQRLMPRERFHFPETPEEIVAEWNRMAIYRYGNIIQMKPGARDYLEKLRGQGLCWQ